MIRFTVEIGTVPAILSEDYPPFPGGSNEFGVGVRISGTVNLDTAAEGEGATLCGIAMAINEYMHSRGAPEFNCLKGLMGLGQNG